MSINGGVPSFGSGNGLDSFSGLLKNIDNIGRNLAPASGINPQDQLLLSNGLLGTGGNPNPGASSNSLFSFLFGSPAVSMNNQSLLNQVLSGGPLNLSGTGPTGQTVSNGQTLSQQPITTGQNVQPPPQKTTDPAPVVPNNPPAKKTAETTGAPLTINSGNWALDRKRRAGNTGSVGNAIFRDLSASGKNPTSYTVQAGDTFYDVAVAMKKMAAQNGDQATANMSTMDLARKLQQENGVADAKNLQVGTVLNLSGKPAETVSQSKSPETVATVNPPPTPAVNPSNLSNTTGTASSQSILDLANSIYGLNPGLTANPNDAKLLNTLTNTVPTNTNVDALQRRLYQETAVNLINDPLGAAQAIALGTLNAPELTQGNSISDTLTGINSQLGKAGTLFNQTVSDLNKSKK